MATMEKASKTGRYSQIIAAVRTLPDNFSATYQEVLKRQAEEPQKGNLFHWILSWVLQVYWPLSVIELQSALQLMEGTVSLDSKKFVDEEYIPSTGKVISLKELSLPQCR